MPAMVDPAGWVGPRLLTSAMVAEEGLAETRVRTDGVALMAAAVRSAAPAVSGVIPAAPVAREPPGRTARSAQTVLAHREAAFSVGPIGTPIREGKAAAVLMARAAVAAVAAGVRTASRVSR